jgi:hypothetical protein
MPTRIRALATRCHPGDRASSPGDPLTCFLSALDPRGDSDRSKTVRLALASCRDPRFQEFLERLYRRRYQRHSLAAIARSCDIPLGEFLQFWHDAQVRRAIYLACAASPDIVRDMIEAALGRDVMCERCEGMTWVPEDPRIPSELIPGFLGRLPDGRSARRCPQCGGSGQIRQPGDGHAARRVLEIAGVIGPRTTVEIASYNVSRDIERLNRITVDVD